MTTGASRSPVLWTGVVIGVVLAAARLAGGGTLLGAAVTLAIAAGYAGVVTLLARRGGGAALLAGRPEDERDEHVGLEAAALAFGLSAVAVLGGFALTQATGGAWQPYAVIAVAMAVAYAGSLVVVRARH